MRVMLVEGVHESAVETLREAGYDPETTRSALHGEALAKALQGVHVLGIRSKTELRRTELRSAGPLMAIGCFCIGTDQVDIDEASVRGVPVFNAPYSNTRSVAELTIAEIVMLARQATHRSMQLHQGHWEKSAAGSREVRNKTLGIIGYGHIGSQLSHLAEAFGMRVVFYDIAKKLPLGNAVQVASLKELLEVSDFVTLHVPETARTRNMIGPAEIALMKRGSCLLNLSRGSVIDLLALRAALESGHLAGAAADVFPEEPHANIDYFACSLRGLPNVILTPHIGGSTEEAQRSIGIEVASAMVKYLQTGATSGTVNFPHVDLPLSPNQHRLLNIHHNVPGVLGNINRIIAEMGGNITSQFLGTRGQIGYLIMDVDSNISPDVKHRIDALNTTIRTRLLLDGGSECAAAR
jgi:D-3-phosphoglycerate dehydrogenase / 2-oxoglutarate reductase